MKMDKPYPGMDKRKSKSEELFLKEKNPIVKLYRHYPKFGQIPQNLLRNPKILLQDKAMYGILHTIAKEKDLTEEPTIFQSGVSISRDFAGVNKDTFSRSINRLAEYGWVTNIRRGLGKANIIILNDKPRFLGESAREIEKKRVEKGIQYWKELQKKAAQK